MIGTVYLDASGVMRRLLAWRTGQEVARRVWEDSDDLVTVTLTYPEVCAGLAAARRNRALSEPGLQKALEAWDALWAQLAPMVLDEDLAKTAGELAGVHALRGGDAVHLAAAQATGCDLLLSADLDLCAAAQRCGLAVVDLNETA